jgi:hypothetical protein
MLCIPEEAIMIFLRPTLSNYNIVHQPTLSFADAAVLLLIVGESREVKILFHSKPPPNTSYVVWYYSYLLVE